MYLQNKVDNYNVNQEHIRCNNIPSNEKKEKEDRGRRKSSAWLENNMCKDEHHPFSHCTPTDIGILENARNVATTLVIQEIEAWTNGDDIMVWEFRNGGFLDNVDYGLHTLQAKDYFVMNLWQFTHLLFL